MRLRLVATSTIWQILSQATTAALSIITVKIISLTLSQEMAGYYHSAYGTLQMFGILADFGLYAIAVRELSRSENKSSMLGAIFLLRTLLTVLSLGSALAIAWLIPAWQGTPLPLAVSIAALVPAFTLFAGVFRSQLQVQYRMHWSFVAEVAQRILTAGLTFVVFWQGVRLSTDPNILYIMLGIGGLGSLLLFIISFAAVRKSMPVKLTADVGTTMRLMKKSAPYGFAFLCLAVLRQIDIPLIAVLRDDFAIQNAYYGFTQRVMEMSYLLPTLFLNSLLPLLNGQEDNDQKSIVTRAFIASLVLGVSLLFASLLWARPLLLLMTNEAYLSTATTIGSDTALRILSFGMLGNTLVLFGFYMLLAHHAWRMLVVTLTTGALLSLMANIILIPRFGFVGAALVSSIVQCLLGALLVLQTQATVRFSIPFSMIVRLLIYIALIAALLGLTEQWLTSSLRILVGIVAAGGLMALIATATGIVPWLLRGPLPATNGDSSETSNREGERENN